MQKSESIKNIAKALLAFQVKAEKIKKDSENPYFKSRYCSLSHILESIQLPLAESGLSFSQLPTGTYGLTTIIMHGESGEYIVSEYDMKPSKDDPQGRGSAITYQRRYALASILGLNIDEDDDGTEASKPETKKQPEVNGTKVSNELPWLNKDTKEFTGALEKMKAGKSDLTKLRKFFRVSKEVETLLIESSKN